MNIVDLAKQFFPAKVRYFFRKLHWQFSYFIRSIQSIGSASSVYCPIAEREFRTFAKIGNQLVTPSNGARNRQRTLWLYLTRQLKLLERNAAVLHVAPELSLLRRLKQASNLRYFPGDKMAPGYQNQAGVSNIDLTALGFENEIFDVIICSHVLEHIPNDALAMREMYRVLKRNGTAIIMVPMKGLEKTYENWSVTSPRDRTTHFGQWDHVRWYGLDIEDRLARAGFETEIVPYWKQFSNEEMRRFGLSKANIIVAHKRI